MIKSDDLDKKPLIGFLPDFGGFGEAYILVKVAKRYVALGGEVVFFSHGGEYEYWAKDEGFKIVRIKPDKSEIMSLRRYFSQKGEEYIIRMIKDEASIYRTVGIKALVQKSVFFSCVLAARVAKIPLITITSGTWTPDYYKQNRGTFPDSRENFFTFLLPKYLKNRITNWYTLNHVEPAQKIINQIAKKLNIYPKNYVDIIMGEYTFAVDDIEFLGLKPTKDFPAENYVGPVLSDDLFKKEAEQDDKIENHLKRPGRSILISLGSDYPKELFLRFLKILDHTEYNVIAVYTTNLKEDELPEVNDNILLKKFVPSIARLNKLVDLAIIHGGLGTVYTAVYAGKPVIGIPNVDEQQFNLDCLVRHGTAIRLSKKYFKERDLLNAIEEIFNKYDTYLENAQRLSLKLPKPEGEKNIAKKLLEITAQTI